MSYRVFYGVHRAHVSDAALLDALAQVARDFDASPQSMLCLLAEPEGDVTWFTFVCSSIGQGAEMAAGFFSDVLADALPDLVVIERHDVLANDVVIRRFQGGETSLEVRSDGGEVIVTRGALGASVPREGDAVLAGLRALGWPTAPAWERIGARSREVVLRRGGAPATPLSIEARAKGSSRVPPVGVIRGQGEAGFDAWRERAGERFPQTTPAVVTMRPGAPPALRPAEPAPAAPKGEAVRLDVRVGKPGLWPDLSAVERVTGRIEVIDSWDPGRQDPLAWGLRVVDLGAVRELKHPAHFYVQGRCERIVGLQLEKAAGVHLTGNGAPRVELPRLKVLRHGRFGLGSSDGSARELVLPALVEAKELTIDLPDEPFVLRLPKLAKGQLVVAADRVRRERAADSVVDVPLLPRKDIELRVRESTETEVLAGLLGLR